MNCSAPCDTHGALPVSKIKWYKRSSCSIQRHRFRSITHNSFNENKFFCLHGNTSKFEREFIPLLSVLENEEFSEILKIFRERLYICIYFIRELMAANLIIMCAITTCYIIILWSQPRTKIPVLLYLSVWVSYAIIWAMPSWWGLKLGWIRFAWLLPLRLMFIPLLCFSSFLPFFSFWMFPPLLRSLKTSVGLVHIQWPKHANYNIKSVYIKCNQNFTYSV